MHVRLAGDARRVAELFGHALDGPHDVLLSLRLGVERLELLQRHRRQNRARPGAKVLGGDVLAGDALQILVDVPRLHVHALAILVKVLEQLVARHVFASAHYLGDTLILQLNVPVLTALARELEGDGVVVHVHVLFAYRGEPVGLVLLRVLRVAYADERRLQELDHRRQDLVAP